MMNTTTDQHRRNLLKKCLFGLTLIPFIEMVPNLAFGAEAPLVTADDPTAKALKYVDDASKASGAKPGSHCANCALYQGATNSKQGPCAIFPGKQVKAAGWCASWAPQV
jgi:hypothetical protein